MASELEQKLARVRKLLTQHGMEAVCLSRAGNVSWLLGGGDSVVSLTDPSVACVVITPDRARVFTSEIERDRLEAEEVPQGLEISYLPWEEPDVFTEVWLTLAPPEATLSDEALAGARLHDFWQLRVPLLPVEIDRYRRLGSHAAVAVGAALHRVESGWTEHRIAAEVARELRLHGIQPAVLLVGGDARLKRYRHPIPSSNPVHDRLMVTVCGRREGLYANLTRMVAFTPLGPQEGRRYQSLLEIGAAALAATRHGRFFRDVIGALQQAYAEHHQPLAWKYHHQGGPTGYFSRDFLATPHEDRIVVDGGAYTWNPSLPGLKVEDTVLLSRQALEVVTRDPDWPTVTVAGFERPDILVRD